MLEKGRFTPAAELPLTEREAFQEMYEMGSLLTTQDAGIRKDVDLSLSLRLGVALWSLLNLMTGTSAVPSSPTVTDSLL